MRSLGSILCCGAAALALAGCGGGGAGAGAAPPLPTATLRVVDGSPDFGTVNVTLDGTSGTALATGAAYQSVGSYHTITAGIAHQIDVVQTANSGNELQCETPTLAAGSTYTVVIAGKFANGYGTPTGLQCQSFTEPSSTTVASGSVELVVHHASPAADATAGDSTISFGTYPAGTTSYSAPLGNATFVAAANSAVAAVGSAVPVTIGWSAGTDLWFAPQTSSAPTSVLATYPPTGTPSYLSIYLVDGSGSTLVTPIVATD